MTHTEVMKLVAMLVATYRNTLRLEDHELVAMSSVYEAMLADLDADAATSAVKSLMVTSKWMPTIAEIRAAVVEAVEGPSRSPADAWGDVLVAIGRHGSYRTPGIDFAFCDPLVARLVDRFGWRDLCRSECVQADRARFIEAYAQLIEQHRRERVTATLPGIAKPRLPSGTSPIVNVRTMLYPPPDVEEHDSDPETVH